MKTILEEIMSNITHAIKTDTCPWCGSPLYVDGVPFPKCHACEFDMSRDIVVGGMFLSGEMVEL